MQLCFPTYLLCAVIVKYITFVYVTGSTKQLCVYCFIQFVFKSVKREQEICIYAVFYNYIIMFTSVVCVYLNYCLWSFAVSLKNIFLSISFTVDLLATNSFLFIWECLYFIFSFERVFLYKRFLVCWQVFSFSIWVCYPSGLHFYQWQVMLILLGHVMSLFSYCFTIFSLFCLLVLLLWCMEWNEWMFLSHQNSYVDALIPMWCYLKLGLLGGN